MSNYSTLKKPHFCGLSAYVIGKEPKYNYFISFGHVISRFCPFCKRYREKTVKKTESDKMKFEISFCTETLILKSKRQENQGRMLKFVW